MTQSLGDGIESDLPKFFCSLKIESVHLKRHDVVRLLKFSVFLVILKPSSMHMYLV